MLITGDMGSDVEELLLRHTQLPDLEVLAAGHHGSQYSTSQALLDQTRPEYALVSVGADNRLRPPGPGDVGAHRRRRGRRSTAQMWRER